MLDITMYLCDHCGNLALMLDNSFVVPECCGDRMLKLVANTVDAAHEKHVPVLHCEDRAIHIAVGETPHPMTDAHHIEWILLLTDLGLHARRIPVGCEPAADFMLTEGEKLIAAYAYCNLHGLWRGVC